MSPHRLPSLLAMSLVMSLSTAACSGKFVEILDSEEGGTSGGCTSAGGTCVANAAQCAPGQGQLGASSLSCSGGAVCCFLPPTACAAAAPVDCCEDSSGIARPRCDGEKLACLPGQTKAEVGKCGCANLPTTCGTSFGRDVHPLLAASCGSASCHGTPNGAKPQIALDSATTRRNLIAQKAIAERPYVKICDPSPTASSILCNIAKSGASCGTGMPLSAPGSLAGSPLDKAIQNWITCGAPEN